MVRILIIEYIEQQGYLLKGNDTGYKDGFAIFVGDKVSLAHGVQIHGRHLLERHICRYE